MMVHSHLPQNSVQSLKITVITHSKMENDHIIMCSKKPGYKNTRKELYKKQEKQDKGTIYKNGYFCSNKLHIYCGLLCVYALHLLFHLVLAKPHKV